MGEGNTNGAEGLYNQAAFQQQRIHELFSRIDKLSVCMFEYNYELNTFNYMLVFHDLNSVFLTVSSKLKPEETTELIKQRQKIRNNIRNKPIMDIKTLPSFAKGRPQSIPNYENQDTITDDMFLFRLGLEEVMDKHGLSNPNKDTEGGWD